MRVVGGIHRGRQLDRVMKETTRETSDMVKVAVFNMLGQTLDGIALDLFAGSGAYGIEALSRGVKHVFFVDQSVDAIYTIKKNIARLNETDTATITQTSYDRFIRGLNQQIFDYVFIDPPYELNIYQEVITRLEPYLSSSAFVICESKKSLVLPDKIGSLEKIKDKTYGIKRITFYKK
ncbi:MAG: 16S rRNA (guanine(966)-N(2))-methyltransferase RsmD [Acholeplasmataceae bacterium]|jgi:16S rRNA (guanine966-N2)-methyltransferase|nr:16S rRNA (guanine(966)-N(2))-methyltransferase RsmD [Acholeplasmataceae bacterium]